MGNAKEDASRNRFAVEWKNQGGLIVRDLTVRLTRANVPPESYGELRAFLDAFLEAEREPVVLARP